MSCALLLVSIGGGGRHSPRLCAAAAAFLCCGGERQLPACFLLLLRRLHISPRLRLLPMLLWLRVPLLLLRVLARGGRAFAGRAGV